MPSHHKLEAYDPSNTSSFSYGTVTKLICPKGGSIAYSYVNDTAGVGVPPDYSAVNARYLSQRVESDAQGNSYIWKYTRTWVNSQPNEQVTVTDPGGNDTVYVFDHGLSIGGASSQFDVGPEISRNSYQGAYSSKATPLQSVLSTNSFAPAPSVLNLNINNTYTNSWPSLISSSQDGHVVSSVTPQYDNSFTAAAVVCYNTNISPHCTSGGAVTYSLGLSTGETVSGATGGPLRSKAINYAWQTSSNGAAYYQANILDIPSSVTTSDGSSNQAAQTTYGYDESNGSPQGVFGLQTSATEWLNTGKTNLKRSTVYNALGMRTSTTDPNGNQVSYQSPACSGLFPQTVIAAYQSPTTLSEKTSYAYDCNTGHVTSVTNPNGVQSTYAYNDPLGRLKLVKLAVGTPAESWTA